MPIGTAATIITGLTALIGSGVSAYGASESAGAVEEESEKARKQRDKEFKASLQEQRRTSNLKGLEYLERQRGSATVAARQRNFHRDLITAAGGL